MELAGSVHAIELLAAPKPFELAATVRAANGTSPSTEHPSLGF